MNTVTIPAGLCNAAPAVIEAVQSGASEGLAAPVMFADAFETEHGLRFAFRNGSHRMKMKPGDVLIISN